MTRFKNASIGSSFAARLLAGIALAGLLTAVQTLPLHADEVDDLRTEVQQLKQQMNYLQNQVPGAGAGGASGGGTVAAQQEVRMQQLTAQMSQLQGQIEQLGIKVDDLSQRLEQMQKDTQFRLGQLEQGGGGAVAGATGAAAGAAAASPAAMPAAPSAGGTVAEPTPLPQSADQMNAGGGLPGPEGTTQQLPQPTAPGTLGTISQNTPLPEAPAGAAEAAAAAAKQTQSAAVANQDPSTIQLPGNSPQEQYEYATGLLQRGAYPEAGLAFKAFVAQHPKDALAGNAQYWLGETYYAQSDYKNAAIAFAEGYQKYPKSSKAPDNLLKLGMSLGQTGRKSDACTAFKQLNSQFPTASAAIKDRTTRAQQRYGCSG
jgi:tol-pal system protein YbgF